MMSRLITRFGFFLALLIAIPSMALTSGVSTSSRQACAGNSTSGTVSSNPVVSALACKVVVTNQWSTGYQIEIVVTNNGTMKVDNWAVRLSVPAAHTNVSLWNAIKTEISPQLFQLSNLGWNGTLLPGQSVSIGATFNNPAGSTGLPSCHVDTITPVNTAPQGNFSAQVTNDTVHVQTTGATDAEGDKLNYRFDFGDGTIINAADVWHSYKTPGNYTITQTISDGKLNKINQFAVTVTAAGTNRAPVAIFSYSTSALNVSLNASAAADKDGDVLTYAWDFGQGIGNFSTTASTGTSLPQGGGFITLTVFDGQLGNTVQYRVITTSCLSSDPQPNVVIESKLAGNLLELDASQSAIANSFIWDFGDGTSATGMFVSHNYITPGIYTVTLRATAQYISVTRTLQIEVAGTTPANLPPVAELSCTESTLVIDDFTNGVASYRYLARCDASASYDPEAQPLSYRINWGDGTSSESSTGFLSHMYATGGEFNVTLQVSDGVKQTEKSLVWIATAPTTTNRIPVACFDIGSGTSLNVNAGCSTDADGDALTYAWDFGDGSSATGVTAVHTYAAAGSYVVKLTVSDGKSTNVLTKTFVVVQTEKTTRCEFKITNTWTNGFTGWFRVHNQSVNPVSNWGAVFKFADGANVSSFWNGTVSGTNPYQVSAAVWNNTIKPGSFSEVGFIVWDGTTTHQAPQISGLSCE